MKISENWLREWVDPDLDSAALTHRLTMLGLEVDSVTPAAPELNHVVVGKVLDVQPHPNADRLSLCTVDVGQEKSLSIVCGAKNVAAGVSYPVALIGAELPGGLKIKRSKLRGEVSEGMLCSAVELGIEDVAEGILPLDSDYAPGVSITEALNLADRIIDIDLTPNRADCFSVLGIACDLAASEKLEIPEPAFAAVAAETDKVWPIELNRGDGCVRFCARVIEDIDPAAETPLWLREKLRRSGIRPISPVVDVTNFVMLELGQPMHGYDLGKLTGSLHTRRAHDGEKLELLDGQTVTLNPEVLVIADQNGAVALAGIMGGASTAVDTRTTSILFESAFFERDVLAGRARRFGLHTDASVRFERGVDPCHQARAIERATALLLEITGGRPGPLIEVCDEQDLPESQPVLLRQQRLNEVLGLEIPAAEVEQLLRGLHMTVASHADGWLVTAPSARFDIAIEEDLIEEVVRLFGYDRIPTVQGVMPSALGSVTETEVPLGWIRESLVARGYQEVITYSFIGASVDVDFASSGEAMPLSNPISSELSVMRRSLWPGLLGVLQRNRSRQHQRVRIFEIGIKFIPKDTEIKEVIMLSGLVSGTVHPEQWGGISESADLFDIKADLQGLFGLTGQAEEFEWMAAEHPALRPGRSARISRGGQEAGWIGELHPRLVKKQGLATAPVLFELDIVRLTTAGIRAFQPISRYPQVRRDLAVIVADDLPVSELEKAVRESAGTSLRDIIVFDIYSGKNIETGSKSVALGLILQETSRTLTETDVDEIMHSVIERLSRDFNATIRE